jgi:hypothetical protein
MQQACVNIHNVTPAHLYSPVEQATCAVYTLSQGLHQHHGWLVGQLQQLAQQPLKGLRMLRVDRGVLVAALQHMAGSNMFKHRLFLLGAQSVKMDETCCTSDTLAGVPGRAACRQRCPSSTIATHVEGVRQCHVLSLGAEHRAYQMSQFSCC